MSPSVGGRSCSRARARAAVARDVEPVDVAGDAEAGAGDLDRRRRVPGRGGVGLRLRAAERHLAKSVRTGEAGRHEIQGAACSTRARRQVCAARSQAAGPDARFPRAERPHWRALSTAAAMASGLARIGRYRLRAPQRAVESHVDEIAHRQARRAPAVRRRSLAPCQRIAYPKQSRADCAAVGAANWPIGCGRGWRARAG